MQKHNGDRERRTSTPSYRETRIAKVIPVVSDEAAPSLSDACSVNNAGGCTKKSKHAKNDNVSTSLFCFIFSLLDEQIIPSQFSWVCKSILSENFRPTVWQLVVEKLANQGLWQVGRLSFLVEVLMAHLSSSKGGLIKTS